MSRSGYVDDCCDDEMQRRANLYRGAVASAIRGRRGQAFLLELLAALDAMPEKRLIAYELVIDGDLHAIPGIQIAPEDDIIFGGDQLVTGRGEIVRVNDCCAFGCLGLSRRVDMANLDPHDASTVADVFGIAEALARELVYVNDDDFCGPVMPEQRWNHVRAWVARQVNKWHPKVEKPIAPPPEPA